MRPRNASLFAVICITALLTPALAQTVEFDVSPTSTMITPVAGQIVTVEPGSTVPYSLGVTVQPTSAVTSPPGLGSFNVNIITNLGAPQLPLTSFSPVIGGYFTLNQSLGIPIGDDVQNISATQPLTGITAPAVGVQSRQELGTGTFQAPQVDGTYAVTVNGTAQLLDTTTNPAAPTLVTPEAVTGLGFNIQVVTSPATQPSGDITPTFPTGLASICGVSIGATSLLCMIGLATLKLFHHRTP